MSKIFFYLTLALWLFVLSVPSHAQQPKPYRIGVIFPGGPMSTTLDGLRQGLKEAGLQEGKQYTLTIKDTKGEIKAVTQAAKTLEQEKIDLIYCMTVMASAAAKESTSNMPIIFSVGSDPVAAGLVDSFARPGGRLTGVHYLAKDLTEKRLEILKQILPKLGRIAIFFNPDEPVSVESAELARKEAKRLGIKVVEQRVSSADELRGTLETLKAGEVDAYF